MKFNVYVLKKRQIIIFFIGFLLILLIAVILLFNFKSKETLKEVSPIQTVYGDIDGDKQIDSIYIATNKNNTYSVNIETKNGDGFSLKPDPSLKTLGYNNNDWPMYIDCKDVNNDGSQEIIIQSSDDKGPLLHVFSYKKSENTMETLVSGRYDVFASSKIDDKPVIMLGHINSNENFTYYTFDNNQKLVSYNDNINLGNESLTSLANFIGEDNVEASNLDTSILSSVIKGKLLDASLVDVKYKNGIPYECIYQIREAPYDKSPTKLYEITMNSTSNGESTQYDIRDIKSKN